LKTVFLEVKQFLINFSSSLFLFYTCRFLVEPIFFDHNPFFLTIQTYESAMPQGHILFLRNPINDTLGLPSHTPGTPLVQHPACCPSSGGTCSQRVLDMPIQVGVNWQSLCQSSYKLVGATLWFMVIVTNYSWMDPYNHCHNLQFFDG
jgi:hypothetical protein